jgi:hypothetical protein
MSTGRVKIDSKLREIPNVSAGGIAVLAKGTFVNVNESSGDKDWLLLSILLEGRVRIGWVQSDDIEMDEGSFPAELNESDFADIVQAVRLWADGHPAADQPLTLVKGKVLSPKALAQEMEEKSQYGRPFLDYLAKEAIRTSAPVTQPIYRAISANQSR